MIYENDTIRVQQDGDSVDLDFKVRPADSVWVGIHCMDISITRKGSVLVVSAWRPGSVSDPAASFIVDIEGEVED